MKKLIVALCVLGIQIGACAQTFTEAGFQFNITSNFFPPEVEILSYEGSDIDIFIPERVDYNGEVYDITGIASFAFIGRRIESVIFPTTIRHIGNDAFSINNLTEVILPPSLETIGDHAFSNNDLINLTIPESVETIGSNSFAGNDIVSVQFNEGLQGIGNGAFQQNEIEIVELPNSVTEIGVAAFQLNKISRATLPPNLVVIPNLLFNSNRLQEIDLPSSLAVIEERAFRNNQLSTISIPSSVNIIEEEAFEFNNLSTITIPENMNYLGDRVFDGNPLLSEVISLNTDVPRLGVRTFGTHSEVDLILMDENTRLDYLSSGWIGFESITSDPTLSLEIVTQNVLKGLAVKNNVLEIHISSISNFQGLEVFDMSGKKILSSSLPRISLEAIPNGIYILKAFLDSQEISKKFVKHSNI